MIYRFTMVSDEVEDFMREIQIDSDATFLDFHKTILSACGYSDDQLTYFTVCENGWEKGQDVTLERMDTDSDVDSYVMDETPLSDLLEEEKQHLLYIFDPLTERCLFIELSEIITGRTLAKAKVTRSQGQSPKQTVDFDEAMNNSGITALGETDSEFFGSDISDEDIDLEGLDISEDEPYK